MDKKQLRLTIQSLFHGHNIVSLWKKSKIILDTLIWHTKIKEAQVIFIFISKTDEPDTLKCIEEFLKIWKTVLVPKIISSTKMVSIEIQHSQNLHFWRFWILEPIPTKQSLKKIDVALIPGAAFTKDGVRLGKWKWYYDRFLSKYPDIYKIWICFNFQMVENIPKDTWDVEMDEIIYDT